MTPLLETMLEFSSHQFWLAQAIAAPPSSQVAGDPSALAFLSGSQFLIALIAGVVMAFAFQFLLTNLSIATDVSAGDMLFDTDADGLGKKIRKFEVKLGAGTLFIANIAIFIACFLAVKLTLIQSAMLAAIVSVVIWSVYFLVLLWVGSQAIASVVGSVSTMAGVGLQGVFGTVATALSGQAANAQIVNTVEASVAAVTKDLRSALAPDQLQESVTDYLSKLSVPDLNLNTIGQGFEQLLKTADLGAIADNNLLKSVNRETFVNLIRDRSDFSQQDVDKIANQLETVWNRVLGQGQEDPQEILLDFIRTASPEELRSGQLRDRLQQLLSNPQGSAGSAIGSRALQIGFDRLTAALAERVDLSDIDVENIAGQLNSLRQQFGEQASKISDSLQQPQAFSSIRTDIEHYLLNSPPWYLTPESIDRGFREVIYDPEASPKIVRQQLEPLNRRYFVDVLTRREGIAADQVEGMADLLEVVRQEVLTTVKAAEEQENSQDLRHRVEAYLHSAPKEQLTSDSIQQTFSGLLIDPDASYETLGNRLVQFDRDTLMQLLLAGRQDLIQEEAEQILNQLEGARDRFLNESQENWNRLQAQATELQQQVEIYLRETSPTELTPEAIQRNLRILLDDPQAAISDLQTRLAHLNRDSLVQLLSQRGDLSEEQINRTIDQIEGVRDSILHAPQQLTEQAKEQTDRLLTQIADYLRNTNLEELNPEGIQQDLLTLLHDPQAGASALRSRLAHIDRETLVKLLSQRGDLTPEQVNRTIDQVQEAIQTIVKTPRRLAIRTRDRLRDFPNELADYLRKTQKAELNPEGIKRDLQLLLKQPRAGLEQLGDRVSHVDRSTLVSLLSQREDISEEEANQIADQIVSVRDQIVDQVKAAQQRVQSVFDGLFTQLRDYLNALERPELNYEGIQQDLRQLFDDPEAGVEAIRDRLSQFDRETLVALLSSRSDISEADADQIVSQIESVRDSILNRAERLQAATEKQIKALKHQAKEQAEAVQKAAALAAWWLFGTALTSLTTAAIAGTLATGGLIELPFGF